MNECIQIFSDNTGIYTFPEVSRLTGVPISCIRRWLNGYRRGALNPRPALWKGQHEKIDGKDAMGFLDLVEIRFVHAFIRAGVSWKTMHEAREIAQVRLKTDYPFCTNKFATDGKYIIEKIAGDSGDARLVELLKEQRVFREIVEPFLQELDFGENNQPMRWWPLGKQRRVVIDPLRNFGHATLAVAGVPTATLAKSVYANKGSIEEVARWYEITPDDVREAVEFEAPRRVA